MIPMTILEASKFKFTIEIPKWDMSITVINTNDANNHYESF